MRRLLFFFGDRGRVCSSHVVRLLILPMSRLIIWALISLLILEVSFPTIQYQLCTYMRSQFLVKFHRDSEFSAYSPTMCIWRFVFSALVSHLGISLSHQPIRALVTNEVLVPSHIGSIMFSYGTSVSLQWLIYKRSTCLKSLS